jgi:hypothetical protein
MNEHRWDPEEFERLMKLPADDPERIRAERSEQFMAWKHMLSAFESPPDQLLEPRDLAAAEAELAARVERAVGGEVAPGVARRAVPARGGSWFAGWKPALKPALAFATVAVVAAAGWWSFVRTREPSPVRGTGGQADVVLTSARISAGVELRWSAVAGARGYAVLFLAPDLTELARIDSFSRTHLTLRAGALPAGLASGQSVLVEVTALRPYDKLASKPITITVP